MELRLDTFGKAGSTPPASGPITSWQIDGVKNGNSIFLGSKITVGCDCSHKIKTPLLLGRKGMTKLGSILNSRDIMFPTNIPLAKTTVSQWSCTDETWTIKKAEQGTEL